MIKIIDNFIQKKIDEAVAAERDRCARIADRQAWAHGGVHFNGPELNSAKIAEKIRKGEEYAA